MKTSPPPTLVRDRSALPRREWQDTARAALCRLAFLALILGSALQLGGCRAVEAIFKVGVWFGVLIVVTIVAVAGGVMALIMKKSG
jgi:hypothetical protein